MLRTDWSQRIAPNHKYTSNFFCALILDDDDMHVFVFAIVCFPFGTSFCYDFFLFRLPHMHTGLFTDGAIYRSTQKSRTTSTTADISTSTDLAHSSVLLSYPFQLSTMENSKMKRRNKKQKNVSRIFSEEVIPFVINLCFRSNHSTQNEAM